MDQAIDARATRRATSVDRIAHMRQLGKKKVFSEHRFGLLLGALLIIIVPLCSRALCSLRLLVHCSLHLFTFDFLFYAYTHTRSF